MIKHKDFFKEKLFVFNGARNVDKIFKITHENKIIKITSLGDCVCFANDKNEIYKINRNDGTYTQIKPNNDSSIIPSYIPIKFLIGGFHHLVIILENNQIYIHGNTGSCCIGEHKETEITTLKLMDLRNSLLFYSKLYTENHVDNNNNCCTTTITHACCGTYSTIIVLNNREIWYVGKIGNYVTKPQFTQLPFDGIVKRISCGYGHLIVLTNEGEIFGLGKNEYSQLGVTVDTSNITKLTFPFIKLNNFILDAFAVPLSHFTVIVDKNFDIYIVGYCGKELGQSLTNSSYYNSGKVKLNHSIFRKHSKQIYDSTSFKVENVETDESNELNNNWKFNYEKGELSICGAFSSLILVDNLQRNIWLGGMRGNHFTNERIHLQKIDNSLFLDSKEQVLDVVCGSNLYGVLIGCVNSLSIYMSNNLKRMVNICCNEIESNTLSDIDLK